MALPGRFVAAACVMLAAACSPFGGGEFVCAQDDQCTGGPSGGQCEADGRCSFPDAACATGRRYGGFAGAKSNTCVGGDMIDAPRNDATDGPIDSSIDAMIDGPITTPFCNLGDATLTGCWQFEGTGLDGSGSNPTNTADTTSGAFSIGKVGMGLTLNAASVITVGDRVSLDSANLTVEAWIRPTQLPAAPPARMGVLDNDGAYGLFFTDTTITCTHGVIVATFTVPLNVWTHVACTYDGTTGRLYINGAATTMVAIGPLTVGNTNGLVLGGNSPSGDALIGTIDQVRIWNVARTASQICVAAGLPTCP